MTQPTEITTPEAAADRLRRAHKQFEDERDRLVLEFFGPTNDLASSSADLLRSRLNLFFQYGISAGEASETGITLREQQTLLQTMNKQAEARHDLNAKMDERGTVAQEKLVETVVATNATLERIADALEDFLADDPEEEEPPPRPGPAPSPRRPR